MLDDMIGYNNELSWFYTLSTKTIYKSWHNNDIILKFKQFIIHQYYHLITIYIYWPPNNDIFTWILLNYSFNISIYFYGDQGGHFDVKNKYTTVSSWY